MKDAATPSLQTLNYNPTPPPFGKTGARAPMIQAAWSATWGRTWARKAKATDSGTSSGFRVACFGGGGKGEGGGLRGSLKPSGRCLTTRGACAKPMVTPKSTSLKEGWIVRIADPTGLSDPSALEDLLAHLEQRGSKQRMLCVLTLTCFGFAAGVKSARACRRASPRAKAAKFWAGRKPYNPTTLKP